MDSLLLRRRMLLAANEDDSLSLPYFCSDSGEKINSELLSSFLDIIYRETGDDLREKPYIVCKTFHNAYYQTNPDLYISCLAYHFYTDFQFLENNVARTSCLINDTPSNWRFSSFLLNDNSYKMQIYGKHGYVLYERSSGWQLSVAQNYINYEPLGPFFGNGEVVHIENEIFNFDCRPTYPILLSSNKMSTIDSYNKKDVFMAQENYLLPYNVVNNLPLPISVYQKSWIASPARTGLYGNVSDLIRPDSFAINRQMVDGLYTDFYVPYTNEFASDPEHQYTCEINLEGVRYRRFDITENEAYLFCQPDYCRISFKNILTDGRVDIANISVISDIEQKLFKIDYDTYTYPIFTSNQFKTADNEIVFKPKNKLPYTVKTNIFIDLQKYQDAWESWLAQVGWSYPDLDSPGVIAFLYEISQDGRYVVNFYVPTSVGGGASYSITHSVSYEDFEINNSSCDMTFSNYVEPVFTYNPLADTVTCGGINNHYHIRLLGRFDETLFVRNNPYLYPIYISSDFYDTDSNLILKKG